MNLKGRKARAIHEYWKVEDVVLPVFLFVERRNNNRISITKKGVNIRISRYSSQKSKEEFINWAKDWLLKQLNKRPDLKKSYQANHLVSGHRVSTPVFEYVLDIRSEPRKTSKAELSDRSIVITLSEDLNTLDRAKTIKNLSYRIIGQHQLPRVENRIREWNDSHFKRELKAVRIKNNSSNWGSCSHSGNINISAKTLLAPLEVQDYIFVHELAHRIEMNHSNRYWNIVKNVMPDYLRHERWLKQHGQECEI